jgi:hypothetical protein
MGLELFKVAFFKLHLENALFLEIIIMSSSSIKKILGVGVVMNFRLQIIEKLNSRMLFGMFLLAFLEMSDFMFHMNKHMSSHHLSSNLHINGSIPYSPWMGFSF